MKKQLKLGHAFTSQLNLHLSWFWMTPLTIYTLVALGIEPLLEASIAVLLIFGSVLLATISRIWAAKQYGLGWEEVTLYFLGATIKRRYCSHAAQSIRIECVGMAVSLTLAALFGALWFALPNGPLGIEMEIVALFNLLFLATSLFMRLSPQQDNLLYGLMTSSTQQAWHAKLMKATNTIFLLLFAASSMLMLTLGGLAFAWWFAVAVMLSTVIGSAEDQGEFRSNWEFAPSFVAGVMEESAEKTA